MMAEYEILDDRFKELVLPNVQLQQIATGHLWTEGPVWVPAQNCLYFSDIPAQKLFRWSPDNVVSLFRKNTDFANGNTLDTHGRLVTCSHGRRRLERVEVDGSIGSLASEYEGKPLNSPNDVVVKSDGSIWFTDPTYGIMGNYEGNRGVQEQEARNVFCLSADGEALTSVSAELSQPNGLAFSPDETRLYVADSGGSHDPAVEATIFAFDVSPDNRLSNKRSFAVVSPGFPDGLRVDHLGNLWTSSADSVQCYAPDGTHLGKIFVPEVVSNLEFGGPRNTRMFITASTSVYAIHVNVEKAQA